MSEAGTLQASDVSVSRRLVGAGIRADGWIRKKDTRHRPWMTCSQAHAQNSQILFRKKADSSRKTNPIPYETINETAFDSSLLPFAGYASSGFCLLSNTDWHSKDKASGGRIPEHPTTGKGHRNKRRTEGVRRHHEHGKHSIDCCFHQCIVCVDTSQKREIGTLTLP
jgi:hypothetical protein